MPRTKKKPDPRAVKAPLRMKKKPKHTKEQIAALQSHALILYKADDNHAKELGFALLQVRRALPHGEFKKWWQRNKLNQARVSYCMRLAEGKVAAAKIKARSPFRGPYIKILREQHKEIDTFYRFCGEPKPQTPEAVELLYQRMVYVVGNMTLTAGRVREWEFNGIKSPLVELANRTMSKALRGLLGALFIKDVEPAPETTSTAATAGA